MDDKTAGDKVESRDCDLGGRPGAVGVGAHDLGHIDQTMRSQLYLIADQPPDTLDMPKLDGLLPH